jgi:hypothetical protein
MNRQIRRSRRAAVVNVLNRKSVYTISGVASIVSRMIGQETTADAISRDLRQMERKGRITVLVVDGRVIGGTVDQFVLKEARADEKARADA